MGPARLRKSEGLSQAELVFGIVSDCRVAGPVVLAGALNLGDAGETAVVPGRSAIGGSREADIGRAAIRETADLEHRDDGGAERVCVRLDLGGMLAGAVCERVGADLGEWNLGQCCAPCDKSEQCQGDKEQTI